MIALERLKLIRLHQHRRRERRRFGRDADVYLRGVLQPELGADRFEIISDLHKTKVYRADSPRGPLAVKLYRSKEARQARRAAALHPILEAASIPVAPLVRADISTATGEKHGLVSITSGWMAGRSPSLGDAQDLSAAFGVLARIHAIESEVFEGGKAAGSASFPLAGAIDREWAAGRVDEVLDVLPRAHFPIDSRVARAVNDELAEGLDALFREAPSPSLLHLDFSLRNVIVGDGGEVGVLDCESSRRGWFGFDLAPAILELAYGLDSAEIAHDDVGRLFAEDPAVGALDAYFKASRPGRRAEWESHSRTIVRWTSVVTIGKLAKRSSNSLRYDLARRRVYFNQAQAMWNALARSFR